MISRTERQQYQVEAGRAMSVYKRDDMIQKARFSLSIQEQRTILFAISKIKPTDSVFEEYTFDIKDFYQLCGIEDRSYTRLKQMLIGLKQKTWWVKTGPDEESTVSWFNKVRTNKKSGKVTIRFDDDMMPYLLQLAEQETFYTSYNLQYVLPMQSQYSPRLYEVLKSYQKNNRQWYFEIDELRDLLDCRNYSRWVDLKRWAIEPAIEEINKYTDIKIAYRPLKEGRKITRVEFLMKAKTEEEATRAKLDGAKAMDGEVDIQAVLDNYFEQKSLWE